MSHPSTDFPPSTVDSRDSSSVGYRIKERWEMTKLEENEEEESEHVKRRIRGHVRNSNVRSTHSFCVDFTFVNISCICLRLTSPRILGLNFYDSLNFTNSTSREGQRKDNDKLSKREQTSVVSHTDLGQGYKGFPDRHFPKTREKCYKTETHTESRDSNTCSHLYIICHTPNGEKAKVNCLKGGSNPLKVSEVLYVKRLNSEPNSIRSKVSKLTMT